MDCCCEINSFFALILANEKAETFTSVDELGLVIVTLGGLVTSSGVASIVASTTSLDTCGVTSIVGVASTSVETTSIAPILPKK